MIGRADATRCDSHDGSCHLCGDEAVAGRVVQIDIATRTATIAFESGTGTVALDLVDAQIGDRLLVHLGFAIERLSREATA